MQSDLYTKAVSPFAQADNDKMQATNESYELKMNIIVILFNLLCSYYQLCFLPEEQLFCKISAFEQKPKNKVVSVRNNKILVYIPTFYFIITKQQATC